MGVVGPMPSPASRRGARRGSADGNGLAQGWSEVKPWPDSTPTIGGTRGVLHWGHAGQGRGGHHFLWGAVGRRNGAVSGGLAGREARGALAARKSRCSLSRGPIAAPPKTPTDNEVDRISTALEVVGRTQNQGWTALP